MSYTKQIWANGDIITAAKLNHIEDGISAADERVSEVDQKIDETIEELSTEYAKSDGSYEGMTVGNAEQLVATVGIDDSVPYTFRTSGGSADIGDRETDMVVGGTIAWNQGNSVPRFEQGVSGYQSAGGTFTVSDNIAQLAINITPTNPWDCRIQRGMGGSVLGHKYLISAVAALNKSGVLRAYAGQMTSIPKEAAVAANTYTEIYSLASCSTAGLGAASVSVGGTLSSYGSGDIMYVKSICWFDLTQMFGSAIADYIYSLEQATAGAGVAFFRKLFPKPYYEYNAGELLSVNASAHKMVGFNAWDEEWEAGSIDTSTGNNKTSGTRIRSKNYIPIIPNAAYCTRFMTAESNTTHSHIECYYDADKNFISGSWTNALVKTTPANAHYMRFATNDDNGTTYNHDICINLSWDGERNSEYEPYVEHTYPLDSSLTLRGIPKLSADNTLYYDGDTYESDGTVTRKYGVVDLGSLNWSKTTYANVTMMSCSIASIVRTSGQPVPAISSIYEASDDIWSSGTLRDKIFSINYAGTYIYVYDSAYTDATAFKAAMSGQTLVYALATPTEEEADPYQNPQIVDDFGTEEYIVTEQSGVAVPVGHETTYQANLRAKLEMAPDSPDGDGDYIVRQSNGQNSYVPITFPADELPAAPTTDGNYVLKCTVSNGTATFTWATA